MIFNFFEFINEKLTLQDFIDRSIKIHGDKYDYSKVEYKNSHTPVKIICKRHGLFSQTPSNHLHGKGCKPCGHGKIDTIDFIKKSKEIHGDKYDYSKVNYTGSISPVVINCKKHGDFIQRPNSHLRGAGCIKCRDDKRRSNKDEFIEKSIKIHGNKYDYSKVDYKNADTPVTIMCKKHGSFEQIPYSHLSMRAGCPFCRESKGEIDVAKTLDALNIEYIRLKKFDDCKGLSGYRLPFDFYLPKYNMCIEYDGQQHYIPVFGDDKFKSLKTNDLIKDKYCDKNGIKLLRISYKISGYQKISDEIKKYLSNMTDFTT